MTQRVQQLTGEQWRSNQAASLTEKEFQSQVTELAQRLGWLVYHTYDSRRSTPGFPDLTMVHPDHGLLFRELKTARGRLSNHQRQWLVTMNQAGVDASVWRPEHWPTIIQAELTGNTLQAASAGGRRG